LVVVVCFFGDVVFLHGVEHSSFFSDMQDGHGTEPPPGNTRANLLATRSVRWLLGF
jgi:hypothetical protein